MFTRFIPFYILLLHLYYIFQLNYQFCLTIPIYSLSKEIVNLPTTSINRRNRGMIPTLSIYLNKSYYKIKEIFTFNRSNSLNAASAMTTIGSSTPNPKELNIEASLSHSNDLPSNSQEELFGVPRRLFPYYYAFLLDAITIGLVMPLLPFSVMELGANAFQLSLVISSNYVAQSIGCIIMGRVSDIYGRKPVTVICLFASMLSYIFLAHANSLMGMAVARIVSGSFGGLLPIMQSAVADVSSLNDRPKYLGRIMATFGLGFVIGPAISAALTSLSTRRKILVASIFPFLGLLIVIFLGKETKRFHIVNKKRGSTSDMTGENTNNNLNNSLHHSKDHYLAPSLTSSASSSSSTSSVVPWEITLLVLNGFALMYTFATETIYAMFIKDAFGYGEETLSRLFAINGSLIGIFQIFFIKPLITLLGQHTTLAIGNLILSLGIIGVALIRHRQIHFILFAIHIIGYSIADTSLTSLITRYSMISNQGSDLALNQAAQAVARVISPIVAGLLYEYSKKSQEHQIFPIGALPFIASSLLPATAVTIPLYLKFTSNRKKEKLQELRKLEEVQTLLHDNSHSNNKDEIES